MSLPNHQSHPPGSPQTYQALPPTQVVIPLKSTLGRYFNLGLWRTVMQQASRHRYWTKGAAISYGIACSLLLGFLALVMAAALKPAFQSAFSTGLTLWLPTWAEPIISLINQIIAEWSLFHRWLLVSVSGGLATGIWLKVVGFSQHIIRSDGDLASHLVPSIRQRFITVLVALVSVSLTLLSIGFVLMTLPNSGDSEIAATPLIFGQRLFTQTLRWCLALSTITLVFGLLYRCSQKSSARATPVLPGTVLATLFWLLTGVIFKSHLASLANQHWLWSMCSTLVLSFLGLYLCILGLLLGGQYNKLIHRYFPGFRQSSNQPPPPSFESFTIQKRPYR